MKKLIIALFIILLVGVLIFTGCAKQAPTPASKPAPAPAPTTAPAPAPATSWPKLTFMTTSSGTNPHTVVVAWSTLARKYVPGLQISVEPTVGAPQATIGFLQGQGDLTYSPANVCRDEFPKYLSGKTMAAGPQHLLASVGGAIHIITRADTNIKTIADFKGKKILCKVATGEANEVARRALLAQYGMTDNDIIAMSGNNGAHLAQQLREGIGDAAIIHLGLRDPSIVELCTMKDIRWIPVPPDKAGFADDLWLVAGVIPPGTYPNQNEAVPAVRLPGSFNARGNLAEEVTYTLIKLYDEHYDEFVQMAPWTKLYGMKDTLTGMFLPIHPGVVKYYKEKGYWTPEAEAKQQKLWNKVITE